MTRKSPIGLTENFEVKTLLQHRLKNFLIMKRADRSLDELYLMILVRKSIRKCGFVKIG